MWDFTSPTGFYETPHDWDANYSDKRPIPLPDPPAPYSPPPETQRVSSLGNQRVPLLGKQRVSEESRTDSSFIPNASVLQTNNGHISRWDQARESELARILMSKSIRYCYQDTSYADPDKGIHVQFNLTDSNITAPFPTHGNNTTTVSQPQPPVPSDHND